MDDNNKFPEIQRRLILANNAILFTYHSNENPVGTYVY